MELISFALCPFAHRTHIMLLQKGLQFSVTFIDLKNKPEWFLKLNPLGKVPVLKTRHQGKDVVIFESAVINTYLDTLSQPPLLHPNPLERAIESGLIEVGGAAIFNLKNFRQAASLEEKSSAKEEFFKKMRWLQIHKAKGKYFRGESFSIMDVSFAPLFVQAFLVPEISEDPQWELLWEVRAWGEQLTELPVVKDSMVSDYKERFQSLGKRR